MHTAQKESGPIHDPCKQAWDAYLEALKESVDATEAANPFISLMPVGPGQESVEIRSDGMWAFRRLSKAKEAEFEKFKAWVDCRKAHGM